MKTFAIYFADGSKIAFAGEIIGESRDRADHLVRAQSGAEFYVRKSELLAAP